MITRLVVTGLLVSPLVSGQSLSKTVEAQHTFRSNRVWSLHLQLTTCGLKITNAQIAEVYEDGNVSTWLPARKDYLYLQWTYDTPEGPSTFGIGDLLAQYGQRLYILKLVGYSITTQKPFVRIFWVSPAGVSTRRIPRAPIRDSRFDRAEWNVDEVAALNRWIIMHHQWSNKDMLREFHTLAWHLDRRTTVPIHLKAEGCAQASLGE